MFEYLLSLMSQITAGFKLGEINTILLHLAKGSLYLLITRPLNLHRLFLNFSNKRRRTTMNGLVFYLRHITALFFIVLLTQSCYTTLQTARSSGEDNYDTVYSNSDEDDYYLNDDNPVYAQTVLTFRPSRFVVVKEKHYGVGNYHRKAKYTVYEYDPWYDPWYDPYVYYSSYDRFSFSFYINIGLPPHRHRPWLYVAYYYPYSYWEPWIVWYDPYDPWCWNPVWYPYPIYSPIIIYDPTPIHGPDYPPVHYDPYYPPDSDREYKKRDWDKRQPGDGRRIVGRGSSDRSLTSISGNRQSTRIIDTGSSKANTRRSDHSGRSVERKQTYTNRGDSRSQEKKQTPAIHRSPVNSREADKRSTTRTIQKPMERNSTPANRIIAREITPVQEKREPVSQNFRRVEQEKTSNKPITPATERVNRSVKNNESTAFAKYSSRPQSGSAPQSQQKSRPESRNSNRVETQHYQNHEVKAPKPEMKRTESKNEQKTVNRSSSVGRRSR